MIVEKLFDCYIIELFGQKSRFFPIAKITRNSTSCTDCQLCTIKCPQGIDVAAVETVKHVDCNLCGDCLLACPVNNTLTINKKKSLILCTVGTNIFTSGKLQEWTSISLRHALKFTLRQENRNGKLYPPRPNIWRILCRVVTRRAGGF